MTVFSSFADLLKKVTITAIDNVEVKCGSEVISNHSSMLHERSDVVNELVLINIGESGLYFCYILVNMFLLTSLVHSGAGVPFSERLRMVSKTMMPASTYSKVTCSMLQSKQVGEEYLGPLGIAPCNHRSHIGHHVSIYYPGFSEFTAQCQKMVIESEDCKFAYLLCTTMQDYYGNEDMRKKAFVRVLNQYFTFELTCRSHGGDANADIYLADKLYIVVKNEPGATQCDPYSEATSYYVQGLKNKCVSSSPAFVLTLDGTYLTIYGAVYPDRLYIDMLTPPIWLVNQRNNTTVMERIARTLKSLKESVNRLCVTPPLTVQHEFPYLQNHNAGEGEGEVKIHYIKEIKLHLFRATLKYGNGTSNDCIVKFTEQYGKSVHRHLAEQAPKLHFTEKIGQFTAVVMSEIKDAVDVQSYLDTNGRSSGIKEQCYQIVDSLKSNKYVHGDLRPNNILVSGEGGAVRVRVIDFDWAGIENEQSYPSFMNHVDIPWPEGARDGQPILHEHDKYWIDKLFESES